ncbi:unnamed protein product [Onchocerca flexuosa]|uniref:Uncharacterized protein n=1 Tax=Onchocerca flexuosa TaxID=387005 RepID=A0A183H6V3_9BILA|nr:unnamed protein product [Onchocerca flexuosa]
MSKIYEKSSIPAKGKIPKLISEVQEMDWKPIDQEKTDDERYGRYENRKLNTKKNAEPAIECIRNKRSEPLNQADQKEIKQTARNKFTPITTDGL